MRKLLLALAIAAGLATAARAQITGISTLPGPTTGQLQWNDGYRFKGVPGSDVRGASVTLRYLRVTYDVRGGTAAFSGSVTAATVTVTGNAFSVGGSSFVVTAGSAALAYLMTARGFSGDGSLLTNLTSSATLAALGVSTTALSASTASLQVQLLVVGQDTAAIHVQLIAIGVSTSALSLSTVAAQTQLTALAVSTTSLSVSTAAFRLLFNSLATSTNTIAVSTTALSLSTIAAQTQLTALAVSTTALSGSTSTIFNAMATTGTDKGMVTALSLSGIFKGLTIGNAAAGSTNTVYGYTDFKSSVNVVSTITVASGAQILIGTMTNSDQSTMTVLGSISASSFIERFSTLTATCNGTYTINWSSGTHDIYLAGNCTIVFVNDQVGQDITIYATQTGAGSFSITWPSNLKWTGGAAPTPTTTASRMDEFFIRKRSATYYVADSSLNHY